MGGQVAATGLCGFGVTSSGRVDGWGQQPSFGEHFGPTPVEVEGLCGVKVAGSSSCGRLLQRLGGVGTAAGLRVQALGGTVRWRQVCGLGR